MLTLQTALRQGTEILEKSGIPAPRLTAEVLLSHALRCDRAYLVCARQRRAYKNLHGFTTAAISMSG